MVGIRVHTMSNTSPGIRASKPLIWDCPPPEGAPAGSFELFRPELFGVWTNHRDNNQNCIINGSKTTCTLNQIPWCSGGNAGIIYNNPYNPDADPDNQCQTFSQRVTSNGKRVMEVIPIGSIITVSVEIERLTEWVAINVNHFNLSMSETSGTNRAHKIIWNFTDFHSQTIREPYLKLTGSSIVEGSALRADRTAEVRCIISLGHRSAYGTRARVSYIGVKHP